MLKKVLLLVGVSVVFVLSLGVLAQDDDFTCDDGQNDVLNAAQAAFEAGDNQEALALVEQALDLCTGGKRSQARRLRNLIESSLAQTDNAPSLAEFGPYDVGQTTLAFVDEAREGRELVTEIWYPAALSEEARADAHQNLLTSGNGVRDADANMSGAPYPLVVYSHFSGGDRYTTFSTAQHLTSYGFVVISTDHLDRDQELGHWSDFINRPLDALFMIDQIAGITEGVLFETVDTDNVGIFGYSYGGLTALLVSGAQVDPEYYLDWCSAAPTNQRFGANCLSARSWDQAVTYREQFGAVEEDELWPPFTDERIQAVMPMAPYMIPLLGERGLANVNMPIMIAEDTRDTFHIYDDAVFLFNNVGSEERYLISFIDVSASLFLNSINQSFANHFTVAFFGFYLQEREDYAQYLTAESVESFDALAWGPYTGE